MYVEYILQHDGNLLLDSKKTLLLYVCRRWHKNIPQKNQQQKIMRSNTVVLRPQKQHIFAGFFILRINQICTTLRCTLFRFFYVFYLCLYDDGDLKKNVNCQFFSIIKLMTTYYRFWHYNYITKSFRISGTNMNLSHDFA